MAKAIKEQIILVPRVVYEKARVLREHKMYQSAIDLNQRKQDRMLCIHGS